MASIRFFVLAPIAVMLLVPAEGNAQPAGAAGLTATLLPIPLLPDGQIPPELDSQYVFLDPKTQDLVLSFPDAVDSGVRGLARNNKIAVKLRKHTLPFAITNVLRTETGEYIYTYNLINENSARQAIGSFTVPVPNIPSQKPEASTTAPWQISTREAGDKVLVQWAGGPGTTAVAPGAAAGGFAIRTIAIPGFVPARVRGAVSEPELADLRVPAKVKEQLARLVDMDFDSQTVLTIGPVFHPSMNRLAIAANFFEGINVLVKDRHLTADSPFVKEVLAALGAFLAGAQTANGIPASEYVGVPVLIRQTPVGNLETQIWRAMQISLGLA